MTNESKEIHSFTLGRPRRAGIWLGAKFFFGACVLECVLTGLFLHFKVDQTTMAAVFCGISFLGMWILVKLGMDSTT